MNIADFDRAACLASDHRHPAAGDRVREILAAKGLDCRRFLNGAAGSLRLDPTRYDLVIDRPPPVSWLGLSGEWCHFVAFKEIVRRAARDGATSLLIVEDDLVLSPDFDVVVSGAEVPADWSLLYYGANHTWHPTEDAGRNVLRLHGSFCTHCIGIRRDAFGPILDLPEVGPTDWAIGVYLHHRLPSYAIWPSVALQLPGRSSMTGDPTDHAELFASKGRNRATGP